MVFFEGDQEYQGDQVSTLEIGKKNRAAKRRLPGTNQEGNREI